MAQNKNQSVTALKKNIKQNTLSSLYLFCGEEIYLKEYYENKIKELIPDAGFAEFNHIIIEGDKINLSEYDDAIESFPMMTDRKLIIIKDSNIFKSPSEDIKKFWIAKFERVPNDTVIIFSETNVDKRSSTYKALLKHGEVIEFHYMNEPDLITWVVKECLMSQKKISKDTAQYFISICDNGLINIKNELSKLLSFCDEEIYKSDVERVVSKSMQIRIFELTDSIMTGDTQNAMAVLTDLKTIKENVFTILYLLFSTFDKMLHIKYLDANNMYEIAQEIGTSPYIASKYMNAAKGFTEKSLEKMVMRVPEIDLEIKDGLTDDWTALERYIMECIHSQKRK